MSKVHSDGRKNERFLSKTFENIDKNAVRLSIMGSGWDEQVSLLRESGFSITYYEHFDRDIYLELVPELDYFVYFSFDEGSMSFLDAVAADVKCIVTPQGFHLDIPGAIDMPISSLADFTTVVERICSERKARAARVASWTWEEYAWRHTVIWDYLSERADPVLNSELRAFSQAHPVIDGAMDSAFAQPERDFQAAQLCHADGHVRLARHLARKALIYNPMLLGCKKFILQKFPTTLTYEKPGVRSPDADVPG